MNESSEGKHELIWRNEKGIRQQRRRGKESRGAERGGKIEKKKGEARRKDGEAQ